MKYELDKVLTPAYAVWHYSAYLLWPASGRHYFLTYKLKLGEESQVSIAKEYDNE